MPDDHQRHTAKPAGIPSDLGDPYVAAGVDYRLLDRGKRLALRLASSTSQALERRGANAIDRSRGEPAFMFELEGRMLAFVLEGLGTKSLIAQAYRAATGNDHFGDVAYDTVAAILNDLVCVGALPLVVNAYFATGSSDWYEDEERAASLMHGWLRACNDADCAWGGGESPSLTGLVSSQEIELAGSAVGVLPTGSAPLLPDSLRPGDELVFVASSGLHANGASLARHVAAGLSEGYATSLPSGISFGEALLRPSLLYVQLVRTLLEQHLPVKYLSHITGHGLLKVMRPPLELSYRLHSLPPVPEVLRFLVEQSGMDDRAAYRTLNMGSGYVVYCEAGAGAGIARVASELGYEATVGGLVEEGERSVVIEDPAIRYAGKELHLSG